MYDFFFMNIEKISEEAKAQGDVCKKQEVEEEREKRWGKKNQSY